MGHGPKISARETFLVMISSISPGSPKWWELTIYIGLMAIMAIMAIGVVLVVSVAISIWWHGDLNHPPWNL